MERPLGLVLGPWRGLSRTSGGCVAESGLPHCDGTTILFPQRRDGSAGFPR
jgi:hypothetical protein